MAESYPVGELIQFWRYSLQARNLSEKTISLYVEAAQQLVDWLESEGHPTEPDQIGQRHLNAFIMHLLDTRSDSTANSRYRSLRQFWKWMDAEGDIIASDPFDKMSPPKIGEVVVPVVELDHVRKLLATCKGTDFESRRDYTMFTMLLDTGARLAELAGMKVDHIDMRFEVVVVKGKGDRDRALPLSPKMLEQLGRYLRARGRHKSADSDWLWLGKRGRLSSSGIAQALKRRADEAGIPHITPHQFRHTFAHQFLAAGGNEGDLMLLAGWKSRQMVDRYGASAKAERARKAHRQYSPLNEL
jgi:site-specific recombinase XerD